MGFPRTPFLSVAEKLPPCRQAQEHGITGEGWALVKEFLGKAVLSMAAQGGLLHGGVQQTGKIFFSGVRDVGADGRKPFHCKGYRVLRRKEGRSRMAAARWGGQIVVAKRMDLC